MTKLTVDTSGLSPTEGGMILHGLTLSGGFHVSLAAMAAFGERDQGPALRIESYIATLDTLEKGFVILWDDTDKRGWLINGTSALLYLVRAKLEYYRKKLGKDYEFKMDQLTTPDEHHRPSTSYQVMRDWRNRGLCVYKDDIKVTRKRELIDPFTSFITEDGKSHEGAAGRPASPPPKVTETYYLFQDLVSQLASLLWQIFEHQRERASTLR